MESPCQAGDDFVWEDLRQAIREEYGSDIISPAKPVRNKLIHAKNEGNMIAPQAPKLLQEKRKPLVAVNPNTLTANQYPLVQPVTAVKNTGATAQGTFRLRISDGNKNSATPAASAAM
jgi:hypothetical protein